MSLFNDLFAFIKNDETIEDSVLAHNIIQDKDTSPNNEKCDNPVVDNFCKALSEFEQLSNVFQSLEATLANAGETKSKAEVDRNGKKEVPPEDSKTYKLCKTCGKKFACKQYLRNHMRFIHGGELFKCDKCNWTTKRKVFLNYHISAKHSDTNLYKCNLCDYGTSRKNNLQSHIQSIHENLQFKCDKCDYTVKSKTVLDDHMKSVHEGSYKFACDQCSYKCMKPGRILEHRNAVHEKVTFQCNLCSMKTTSKSSLKAHIRGQHEGIKHYCDQCEYHSKSIAGLNKHKKLKHMNKEMEE